jgi:dTDP-4-dehydrorhamnose 3,5-epimerase
MIITPTRLVDARVIDIEPKPDERGFFARSWCRRELAAHGIDADIAQESISYNRLSGTLRGLHFQLPPHEEAKIVRCTRGAIFDVIVDLRPRSPTYRQWEGFHLNAENRRALYVPKGFAHGFQTLADDTELFYQISSFHAPGAAAGLRYNDPAFAIVWPLPVSVISERDRSVPDFKDHLVAEPVS